VVGCDDVVDGVVTETDGMVEVDTDERADNNVAIADVPTLFDGDVPNGDDGSDGESNADAADNADDTGDACGEMDNTAGVTVPLDGGVACVITGDDTAVDVDALVVDDSDDDDDDDDEESTNGTFRIYESSPC
jgi:hypothetical protein